VNTLRDIKFRAYDKTNKEMMKSVCLIGRHIVFEFKSHGYDKDELDITYLDILDGKNEYEVMQYTGLKDRNDKEIYEGDIVICNDETECRKRVICYDIHQAKFKAVPKSTYYANAGNGGWTGFELRWHYEVIGNIYENPELFNA
jgi:uncharacterized phage protein (TIGR01671 family)